MHLGISRRKSWPRDRISRQIAHTTCRDAHRPIQRPCASSANSTWNATLWASASSLYMPPALTSADRRGITRWEQNRYGFPSGPFRRSQDSGSGAEPVQEFTLFLPKHHKSAVVYDHILYVLCSGMKNGAFIPKHTAKTKL